MIRVPEGLLKCVSRTFPSLEVEKTEALKLIRRECGEGTQ